MQCIGGVSTCVERDIAINALPLNIMREPNDSRLSNQFVEYQGAFNLRRAHAMPRNIDDIVDPAGNPVIAVVVATAAVASEIFALIGRKIRLHETVVISI